MQSIFLLGLTLVAMLTGCGKKPRLSTHPVTSEDSAFAVNREFLGGTSVMSAARRVFPTSSKITLTDFWTSSDSTHDFVVFFAGREVQGGFESMYWRYLVFVKNKNESDWSKAQVFDLPDNHPRPFAGSMKSLELSTQPPNKAPEPTPTSVTPRAIEGVSR